MEDYLGVSMVRNATTSTSSDGNSQRPMKITDAVAIIAGTAVGGGFLALPSFTSPIGYLPTVLGLCLAFAFLALSALAFCEAAGLASDDARQKKQDSSAVGTSVASVIRQAFGRRWALLAGFGFLAQMLAVMTAQVVKGAELLAELTGMPYRLACVIPMTAIGAWVYANSPERVEGANTILTVVMLAGFGALIASAIGRENLFAGLLRADWMRLLPNTKVPFALPVFVKLLAFGEAMPLLIKRMVLGPQQIQADQAQVNATESKFDTKEAYSKLRKSTFVGASLPLLLAMIWAGISASLVDPADPNPIISLLHNYGPSIAAPVLLLSYGAIGTTILGSLLAMAHFANDMICSKLGYCSLRWSAMASALTVALPCTLACIGPSIYLPLLSFAGAYPTTLLYGLAPALAALVLRRRLQKGMEDDITTPQLVPGGKRTLIALVCAAVGLVGSSTVLALRHLLWRVASW
eukprot:scaffold7234_cov181-Amphora_coffeaeformis.AAC.6